MTNTPGLRDHRGPQRGPHNSAQPLRRRCASRRWRKSSSSTTPPPTTPRKSPAPPTMAAAGFRSSASTSIAARPSPAMPPLPGRNRLSSAFSTPTISSSRAGFATLFASADWDFAADNIMLIRDDTATDVSKIVAPAFSADPEFLDFERFIEGNISRRRVQRGELGFLKPVISGPSSTGMGCATTRTCVWAKTTNSTPAPLPSARGSRSSGPAAMARSCAPIR